jgi:hypothetical protein
MDPDAMNVDDPTNLIPHLSVQTATSRRRTRHCAVYPGFRTLNLEEIRKLNMVELRPLLVSGQYAEMAETVLATHRDSTWDGLC